MLCSSRRVPATLILLSVFAVAPAGLYAQEEKPDPIVKRRTSPVDDTDFADPAPSLGKTFKQVPGDFLHFLSVQSAVTLAVGGGAALAVHPWDDDIQDEFRENTRLEDFFAPGNVYGNFGVQLGGAFGVYAIGRIGGYSHLAILGSDLIRAQLLSQGYVQVIKYAAQRERPDDSDKRSFPSGHAAATFATANVIRRHYGWGWGSLGYGLAAYVATARMAHDRHYLSDVIFGAAIGIAGGRTVTVSHDKNRATVTFAPAPGGAAVVVDF
jgi:hypothetical protein